MGKGLGGGDGGGGDASPGGSGGGGGDGDGGGGDGGRGGGGEGGQVVLAFQGFHAPVVLSCTSQTTPVGHIASVHWLWI